jgi:hypothetical protein
MAAHQKVGLNLQELAVRLKNIGQHPCAPLIVASDVAYIDTHWADYRGEAGGKTCAQWVREVSGFQLRWWIARHEAVMRLGEAARRILHHRVAVWVATHISEDDYAAAIGVLRTEQRANHGIPVPWPVASKALRKAGLYQPPKRPKAMCESCKRLRERVALLEQTIRDLGGEVPE